MAQATLGFFTTTRACTHQNPYSYPNVQVFIAMGQGLGTTHGFQTLYDIKAWVNIKSDFNIREKLSKV